MNTIAGMGSHLIPDRELLDAMTKNLIKDKDSDGDNVLTEKELGAAEGDFGKIDFNNDGKVDRVELNVYYPISRLDILTAQLMKDKDANGDKTLSGEELGVTEDVLKEIDTNDDGQADREELNAAHPFAKYYNAAFSQPPPVNKPADSVGGVDVTV